jgi:hypothetical protein
MIQDIGISHSRLEAQLNTVRFEFIETAYYHDTFWKAACVYK